ncbi:hypothetical protein ACFOW1_06285 [Parasediminibacterium paludis]|uniref:TolB-like 6-blade propeller-like n=1 Tax=Parasediminibacterium paludis TaxID=908966 RepID=A0ABV8PX15_9BACT
MKSRNKFFLFCIIFLMPAILVAQTKKISSLELTEFTRQNKYLDHFVVKNSQLYIGTPYVLYTVSLMGEIVDSLMPLNIFNLRATDYTFDVLDKKFSTKDNIFYFFGYLTDIITYKNKNRFINIQGVPHTSFKDNCFESAHTIFDGYKNFYSLYVSEKASNDGKCHPVIAKLDTITGVDMDSLVFNEKKLQFNLNINYETTFRVDDSIFVFANNFQKNKSEVIFADTNFSVKRIIDVQKSLNIPTTEKSLTKIISLDKNNCIFVVSLAETRKDIIARVNYNNGKVDNITTISKPTVSYIGQSKKKVSQNIFSIYKENKYPNQIMYAYDQGKLYALYYENNNFVISTYLFD